MPIPAIYAIRRSLEEIHGAVIDEPRTFPVDAGEELCTEIHVPESEAENVDLSDGSDTDQDSDESAAEEPSIIFEIPSS